MVSIIIAQAFGKVNFCGRMHHFFTNCRLIAKRKKDLSGIMPALLANTNRKFEKVLQAPKPPLCKGRWHGASRDGGIVRYRYKAIPQSEKEKDI
ncbi:MAG: hypothetical protein E7332_09200 [Clostridiales bacterium]|nr:hypothetical protein [Clostridiales bacterium]